MKQTSIKIPVTEFDSMAELEQVDFNLVQKAIEAAKNAYAPYSSFSVGAAIRLVNGEIILGNNQENAAYPSGLCAERVALFWVGSQFKDTPAESMAVVAFNEDGLMTDAPITPCGACRQVFAEYEHRYSKPFSIILVGSNRVLKLQKSTYLLPFGFDPLLL
jgi:cytidine deaminase